jgi:hypothetical protein
MAKMNRRDLLRRAIGVAVAPMVAPGLLEEPAAEVLGVDLAAAPSSARYIMLAHDIEAIRVLEPLSPEMAKLVGERMAMGKEMIRYGAMKSCSDIINARLQAAPTVTLRRHGPFPTSGDAC